MLLVVMLAHATAPLTVDGYPRIVAEPGRIGIVAVDLLNPGAAPVHVTDINLEGDPSVRVVAGAPADVPPHGHLRVGLSWAATDTVHPTAELRVSTREGLVVVPVRTSAPLHDIVIVGTMTRAEVDPVIRGSMERVRACYREGLAKDPSVAGRITVKFAVEADGSVSSSALEQGTSATAEVGWCVADSFRELAFPPRPDGTRAIVSHPFVLTPS